MTTTEPPASQDRRSDDRSRVRYAPVNGIEVACETSGNPVRPAILLVMGLGTQMIPGPTRCESCSRKQATPRVLHRMATRTPATTREAAAEESARTYRMIGSPAHLDEALVRDLARRAYDRAHDPAGMQPQLAAILAQPNRTRDLQRMTVPTLVVHGLGDPLVAPSGGLAIAKSIPGATFIGHSGMGHDLPRTLWRTLAEDILSLVDRVDVATTDQRS